MYAPGSTPLTGFQTGFVAAPDGATKPYVLISGGPASVVVVPGVADGLLTCVDVAAYLAWFYSERSRNCRLLILSRRQEIPANFGIENHAEDMLHTVAHLGWGNAVWECISAAGPIGQWAAVKRPDLAAGLVLSSTFDHVTGRTRKVLGQWLEIVESAGAGFFWDMIEPKYRPTTSSLTRRGVNGYRMNAFTVTWAPYAHRNLAELYRLNPANRREIGQVTNHLEAEMAKDPLSLGVPEIEDIRRVVLPAIAILFKVREAGRLVKALWVKLWDE